SLASEAEPITGPQVEDAIQTGKRLAICEWPLEGSFEGVLIRGQPDFFEFEGTKANLLLEFKFSNAPTPFRDHQVQVQTYGLLAEARGFFSKELVLGIVMLQPVRFDSGSGDHALAKMAALAFLNSRGALHEIHQQCQQARRQLMAGPATRTVI